MRSAIDTGADTSSFISGMQIQMTSFPMLMGLLLGLQILEAQVRCRIASKLHRCVVLNEHTSVGIRGHWATNVMYTTVAVRANQNSS